MNKRNILRVAFAVFMICLFIVTPVFADISTSFPTASGSVSKINTSARRVWGTVTTVVQILAFAAVIFAGLRYMFASADQKADIKKGLGMLAIGAMLVFAASTVVKFVTTAGNQILQ